MQNHAQGQYTVWRQCVIIKRVTSVVSIKKWSLAEIFPLECWAPIEIQRRVKAMKPYKHSNNTPG